MPVIRRLNHVGIVASDREASIAWYCEHLRFERLYDYSFPGVKASFIRHGDIRIEFFESDGATPMDADRRKIETNVKIGGINHFALEVADLNATVDELKAKGVEIAQEPADIPGAAGERFAFIHDNEGMLIELFQPVANPPHGQVG